MKRILELEKLREHRLFATFISIVRAQDTSCRCKQIGIGKRFLQRRPGF